MPFLSYAQNAEDVPLWRVFGGQSEGFYVDVGASSPDESITRAFSQAGWTGLNLEPLPDLFAQVTAARPRDINLAVAASDRRGTATLFTSVGGLSTLESEQSDRLHHDGFPTTPVEVPLVPLADLFAEHVTGAIDFLKVAVEGHERQVLAGNDWTRWRPRVVVVEATEPNSRTPNHHGWEPLLLNADYHFALFDGLNRFYVRGEDRDLIDRLGVPANYFDDYLGYAHHTALARLDEATTAADALTARYHALGADTHALNERFLALTAQSHELGVRHQQLTAQHHTLSGEFHTLNTARLALAEAHRTLELTLDDLRHRHHELDERHDALKSDHHALTERHDALTRTHHDAARRHDTLRDSHRELNRLHNELHERHEALGQQHATLSRQHHATVLESDERHAQLEAVRAHLADLGGRHHELSEQHHTLSEQHHTLSERHHELTAKLTALTQEHQRAVAESADRLPELEDARRQLATLREHHHTLSQQHHTLCQQHHEMSRQSEERRQRLEVQTADHRRYAGWLGPFWWVCGRVRAVVGVFRKPPA